MIKRMTGPFVGFAAMLLAGAAGAHHNMTASFDFNAPVTVTGPLTRVDWRNPHIEMVVDARVGDAVQTWSLEGPPPSWFRVRGVSKSDIEMAVGKTLTVEASRAKNGSNWGLLRVLTLPGGKSLSVCPQNC